MDLFGEEEKNNWGGKRNNSGRPKIQEKRRIILIERKLRKFAEEESKFLNLPPKKQGAHRIACEFLKEIMKLIPKD